MRGSQPEGAQDTGTGRGNKRSPFWVPPWLHALGELVQRQRLFCLWLGRLESRVLEPRLNQVPIVAPVYVCGLARAGSTLLHQILAAHPAVATHRIKDNPLVFTPYWWRRAAVALRPAPARERPHRDGVMITMDSPDATEEMIWMAFFTRCHDPSVSNLVRAADRHPAFESFYRLHLRKVLLAENATRYAAKANYHVARLPYLVRLFPDARFLIPVRAPASHIASLVRQQRLFCAGQRRHPRALAFMQRSGHHEFGQDRRPLNLGDSEPVQEILKAWAVGDEVRGLAIYWNMIYRYLARLLAADAGVRTASLVVPYESMCAAPEETIRRVLDHCRLSVPDHVVMAQASGICRRAYYHVEFSPRDLAIIHQETDATASMWISPGTVAAARRSQFDAQLTCSTAASNR